MQRKMYDQRIFDALMASHLCGSKTTVGTTYTGPILCDSCGKWRAFTFTESPRKSLCNRAECSAYKDTSGISIPEILGISFDWEVENKPNSKDPHRPAISYLTMERCLPKEIVDGSGVEYRRIKRKGMDKAIGGCFWQLYDPAKKSWDDEALNGRGFDNRMKSHNIGSWKNKYFRHQATNYSPEKETWVAESPIDCQSIMAAGIQSLGLVSAGSAPEMDLDGLEKTLVLSPDNDTAGINMVKRWKGKYPDALVMLPPPGMDWNDLFRQHQKDWPGYFQNNRDSFQFYGELALAKTAREYAEIFFAFRKRVPVVFTLGGMTYFSSLKFKGDEPKVVVERIGKFTFKVIAYFWDSTINPNAPECHYQIEIKRADGSRPVLVVATGKDLATISSVKSFLLSRAMVNFEGGSQAATAMATRITTARFAPEVVKAEMTGLHSKSGMYIFQSFAVCSKGRVLRPDKRGFFKINHREWITPADHAAEKAIIVSKHGLPIHKIHRLISDAWGPRCLSALAWCAASWFVSEIKRKIGFYPFLSLWGDVQAAKTSLTIVLNQLQGFNTEGSSSGSMNSKPGMSRTIGRAANIFTSIIEGNDRDERNAFEISSILPLYNINPLAIKALYSNDMQTRVIPFKGALMLSANNELFIGSAEKERTISLKFETDFLNENTRTAHDQLCKVPLPELARTIMLTLQHRQTFEKEWYGEFIKASNDLGAVKNRRIRENHALLLGFHRLFCKVHKIKNSRLRGFLEETAILKEISSAEREHTIADNLFEQIDMISDDNLRKCLHTDPETGLIHMYLAGIEQNLRGIGIQLTANRVLFDALRKHPGFIKSSVLFRFPDDLDIGEDGRQKPRRTWKFDAKKTN